MTLRDLTRKQLAMLQKRCNKERKKCALVDERIPAQIQLWNTAYNLGLKAGLEQKPSTELDSRTPDR